MKQNVSAMLFACSLALMLVAGCTKPYKITTELQRPVSRSTEIAVGEITDELPTEFDESKKPTAQDIESFRSHLQDEIRAMYEDLPGQMETEASTFQVRGSILDYKKGSGFLRFMFGAWAGGSKLTTNLKLIDVKSGDVVFAGNFAGAVTSGYESGSEMWKRVAKDFVGAIKDQSKKLLKAKT